MCVMRCWSSVNEGAKNLCKIRTKKQTKKIFHETNKMIHPLFFLFVYIYSCFLK